MSTTNPRICVLRYCATDRLLTQGFADIEINGAFRLNGVNLMRDGTIRVGQLTPLIAGRRCFISSIEVLDASLRDSLMTAVRSAIHEHVASLPPEQRVKPPRSPQPQKPDDRPGNAAKPQNAPANGKPPRIILPPTAIRTRALQATGAKPVAPKPTLPPPSRLMANYSRRS